MARAYWQTTDTPHPRWAERVRRQLRAVYRHADEQVPDGHLQREWDRGRTDTEAAAAIHVRLTFPELYRD